MDVKGGCMGQTRFLEEGGSKLSCESPGSGEGNWVWTGDSPLQ